MKAVGYTFEKFFFCVGSMYYIVGNPLMVVFCACETKENSNEAWHALLHSATSVPCKGIFFCLTCYIIMCPCHLLFARFLVEGHIYQIFLLVHRSEPTSVAMDIPRLNQMPGMMGNSLDDEDDDYDS